MAELTHYSKDKDLAYYSDGSIAHRHKLDPKAADNLLHCTQAYYLIIEGNCPKCGTKWQSKREMIKISQKAFDSAIRAKMLEPQDNIHLQVIPDEQCTTCELCGYLTADPKIFRGKKICELCYLGKTKNFYKGVY